MAVTTLTKNDIYRLLGYRLKSYLLCNDMKLHKIKWPGITYIDLYYLIHPGNGRPKLSLNKINTIGKYLGLAVLGPCLIHIINSDEESVDLNISNDSSSYFHNMVLDGIEQFVADGSIRKLSRQSNISRSTITKMLRYGRENPGTVRRDIWACIAPIVCDTVECVCDIYYKIELSE